MNINCSNNVSDIWHLSGRNTVPAMKKRLSTIIIQWKQADVATLGHVTSIVFLVST